MKTWRSKQFQIRYSRRRWLMVTVRRFHTSPSQRSRVYRQVIIKLPLANIREVAFRVKVQRPVGRPTKKLSPFANFWRLQASVPLIVIATGFTGLSFFGSQLIKPHSLEPTANFSSPKIEPKQKVLAYSEPTHIVINSVGINADIIKVGQDSHGAIQLPPILDWVAGWYQYSPAPGQLGPAIIVGHVDSYKGISVFWRLRYVKPGDIITINRSNGSTANFAITALKQFNQATFPTKEVYGNINYAGLRLITCGGSFDAKTGNYSENTVVYATLQ